jgi:hypothetical protein
MGERSPCTFEKFGALEVGTLEVGALRVGALGFGALRVGALEVGALLKLVHCERSRTDSEFLSAQTTHI